MRHKAGVGGQGSGVRRAALRAVMCLVAATLFLLPGCEQKDSIPADPHAALKFGWTQLSSADFDIAQEAFQRAADTSAPGSRDFLMAKFGLANTHQHRKPTPSYEDAARIYQELATADKGGEIGAWSALAIVRMQHLKLYEVGHGGKSALLPSVAELDVVREGYKHVSTDFPNTDAGAEASMYLGASYIEAMDTPSIDTGIAFLKDWLTTHEQSPYCQHAYSLISSGYETEARDDPAKWPAMLDALLASVKRNTDPDADLSGAYYRIARVAEIKTKQLDIAKEYYWKLKRTYPTDSRIFYCNRALIALGETVTDIPADSIDAAPPAGAEKGAK